MNLTFLWVGEHFESRVDVLELLLGFGRRIHIGMEFPREPAIRLLQVVRGGVPRNTQDVVIVLGHVCSRCHVR
jgi:hypothetical protein